MSLRGDDHKRVADLPGNFPDVDSWVSNLALPYEHRLRADYDNWSDTAAENVLAPVDCLAMASDFLKAAERFLLVEYRLKV